MYKDSRFTGCFWITGLPGAGKTTIASSLQNALVEQNVFPILLDGDRLRQVLNKSSSHYDTGSRLELAKTYSKLCQLIVSQNQLVICATVSMFDEVRNWNRDNIPGYVEVFVDVPKEILVQRNQKGLYDNTTKQVPGLPPTIELPKNPNHHFINDGAKPIRKFIDNLIYELKNSR